MATGDYDPKEQQLRALKFILPIILALALVSCATTGNLTQDEQNRLIISTAQTELGNLWDQALAYKEAQRGAFDERFEDMVRPAFLMAWDSIDKAANMAEHQASPVDLAREIKTGMGFLADILKETGVVK